MRYVLRHQERGFSLVELLIAMSISGVIFGATVTFFITQRRYLAVQEQVTDMVQSGRIAMDTIVREVRMAGYGAPSTAFAAWIPWVSVTTNPQITQGSGVAPDVLSVVGSLDTSAVSLAAAAVIGGTSLTVSTGGGSKFNTTTQGLIYIGASELAVVKAVAGDTLTIDTNPTSPGNQGLTRSYAVGTSVELVQVMTYQINANTLQRNDNTGAADQPVSVADNIEDLQITQNGTTLTISLTARTAKPDFSYTHPTKGDHYRRMTLTSEVRLRNL